MSTTVTRSEKLDLRLTPDAKRTLQTAAAAANRSVSDFVLERALQRAAETLPDDRLWAVTTPERSGALEESDAVMQSWYDQASCGQQSPWTSA
jgi:uncharacterized protein (DUF1778 family)